METNKILGLVVGQHYSDRAFDTVMNSRSGETICAVLNPCRGGWNVGRLTGTVIKDGRKKGRERGGGRHERKEERERGRENKKNKFAHFIHHLLA